MIDAGINNGDTAIIKRTSSKIVVRLPVLVDDQEALKKDKKKGKTIALEPANKNYETKIYARWVKSR